MIVVDFIDMDRSSNRNKVTRAFNEFLRKDRAKAAVTRISELGLVEMTRKRTRESLLHHLTEPCQHCEGKGYTKSRRTVAYGVLRELRRQGNLIEGDTVVVEVHPDVAQVFAGPDHAYLEEIEKRLQKRILVKARASFELEDFELHSPGQKAIEHSDNGRDGDHAESRRRRRRKKVGPPAEVQAMLDEEERGSVDPEAAREEAAPDAGEASSERQTTSDAETRATEGPASAEASPSREAGPALQPTGSAGSAQPAQEPSAPPASTAPDGSSPAPSGDRLGGRALHGEGGELGSGTPPSSSATEDAPSPEQPTGPSPKSND
jgi:ribonuclease G